MNATAFPVWIDGTVVEANAAHVHIMTPSLHYGWGVYEGVRFYATQNGPAAFRLTAHLERLRRSAKALGMNIPFTDAALVDACKQVVSRSGLAAGYIRPIVFLREGAMSVAAQLEDVRVAIGCWAWSSYLGSSSERIRVRTSGWTRSSPNSLPPSVKSTGGYINASLARLDAIRGGDQEAIMLNAAGRVAEASAANVFMVMEGELLTPPLSEGILPGITRDSIISMAQDIGINVIERPIAPAELRSASEIMLAGTAVEWVSVGTLDGQVLDKTNAVFVEL
jgi:branched-chain amino acid aminotransferase